MNERRISATNGCKYATERENEDRHQMPGQLTKKKGQSPKIGRYNLTQIINH